MAHPEPFHAEALWSPQRRARISEEIGVAEDDLRQNILRSADFLHIAQAVPDATPRSFLHKMKFAWVLHPFCGRKLWRRAAPLCSEDEPDARPRKYR